MSKQSEFISAVAPGAISGMKKYGVLASVTIAQAILESGWGDHAPGNNLFGIKAGKGWAGSTQTFNTTENVNGEEIRVEDQFRAYDSTADSIEDHGAFLAGNSRYANIIGNTNAVQVCELLSADGYATEPDYASELANIIAMYNLTQYDAPDAASTASPPDPRPSGDPTIKAHQQTLNRLQIRDDAGNTLAEDGVDGPCTQQATRRLQSLAGISVDGVWGPQTDGAVQTILSKPMLQIGSYGVAVRYVQFRTEAVIDGRYGVQTAGAVKDFQCSVGAGIDGITGPETWGKFLG